MAASAASPGRSGALGARRLGRRQTHVLELVGHDVGQRAQPARGVRVVVAAHDDLVGDGRGGACRVRVQRDHAVAHLARRDAQHAAELAAPEDPDRGTGGERFQRVGRRPSQAHRVQRVLDEPALALGVDAVRHARRRIADDRPLGVRVGVAKVPGRHGARRGTPAARPSSRRAGGITWRWTRNGVPSWSTWPMSIGRVGGKNVSPPWRPNPSDRAASVTSGISSGSASTARSTTFLPGSPGTEELPTWWATVPGRAEASRRASSRATSAVRGSDGSTLAGRLS